MKSENQVIEYGIQQKLEKNKKFYIIYLTWKINIKSL